MWNRSLVSFDAWDMVLRVSTLGWPWGMGWGGRWKGCSGWGTHVLLLLLLLLSRFSLVWLCASPQMAAHQAPLSLGFSRQEYWSGVQFPSPMHGSEKQSEVAQSCPPLSNLMDCSLPGSSVHGIFQARVLEWGAIAFSRTHIHLWLILVNVWQKPLQYCK